MAFVSWGPIGYIVVQYPVGGAFGMQRVAIVGAGQGGFSLLKLLAGNRHIEIVGVCDIDPIAPGMIEAQRMKIRTFVDCARLVKESDQLDLIISVTNDSNFDSLIEKIKQPETAILRGHAAHFLWELVSEQQRAADDAQQRMLELKELYELGLKLSSSVDLREVYSTIIDYATMLTNTPAGSISLLDERTGEMSLATAKGFSNEFYKFNRWKLRVGGLTSHILNQEHPIIINDITALNEAVNPALAAEGVRSIIAAPLTARGKIIGILYVDDFKTRDFSPSDASILGLLSGFAALTIEKMKLLDDTKRMAITDGLTGLRNQQEFLNRLDEEVSRALRYGRPLSMVALDLDHFKKYNDEFGHLAGNELLRVFADIVSANCRVTDVSGRTGGEEFAIVMPETDFEESMRLAERLRETIEGIYVNHGNVVCRVVTASIGVASFPIHGKTAMELYQTVDQALYKAKDLGRNRVVGFPDRTIESVSLPEKNDKSVRVNQGADPV